MQELRSEGQRVRTNLKVLESLTFNCTNPEQLRWLSTQIEAITLQFKGTLPTTEGLVVRPMIQQRTKKLTRSFVRKYGKLQLTGQKERQLEIPESSGEKADYCRKVNLNF